jgi:hypothetical protein
MNGATLADELLGALDGARPVEPPSVRPSGLSLEQAFAVADTLRRRRIARGANGLDGPLTALRLWLQAMARWTPHWRVQAGDVVTTGTLTDAWPMVPGQTWRSPPTTPRWPASPCTSGPERAPSWATMRGSAPTRRLQARTPERWQSGRMHRIRNPAYRFSCTEGSNPSCSARIKDLAMVCAR